MVTQNCASVLNKSIFCNMILARSIVQVCLKILLLMLIKYFLYCPCSINTVYYMAPFATMILAVPALLLEGAGVLHWVQTCPTLLSSLVIIFGSGVMAFCLNFSIFYVIHSTTAVTFNVAGNLKVRCHVLQLHYYICIKQIIDCHQSSQHHIIY